jgi:hypothetical protein
MPKFTFSGYIIPKNAQITVNNPPRIEWKAPESNLSMVFSYSINDGIIRVDCEADRDDAPHQTSQMHMRALDIARTTVNLVAFTSGHGISVILDTLIDPQGKETRLIMRDAIVGGLCTAYDISKPSFGNILNIIFQDPPWFLALNDLIESVSLPHVTPRNCGRAIESLRNLVSGLLGADERKRAWGIMNDQLNLSEKYTRLIMDNSTGPRHGQTDYVPYETSNEIKRRSWTIMNRFIEWKFRGNQKLPLTEFPVLV